MNENYIFYSPLSEGSKYSLDAVNEMCICVKWKAEERSHFAFSSSGGGHVNLRNGFVQQFLFPLPAFPPRAAEQRDYWFRYVTAFWLLQESKKFHIQF